MKLEISGVVQGVGFRPAVVKLAVELGLTGSVQNTGSNVEVMLSGGEPETSSFIRALKDNLPPLARIDTVQQSTGQPEVGTAGQPEAGTSDRSMNSGFIILPSSKGSRNSPIPPDTSMCQPCLDEMLAAGEKRYEHAFTNCTDCGARFSIIEDLPYDRPLTTMGDFPMCQHCRGQYDVQGDRRFHAQTISCPDCGPAYTLYNSDGQKVEGSDGDIKDFAKLISEGQLGIMKGWGGSHIVCLLSSASQLREWYGREQKPFAIMARDINAVKRYADAGDEEIELLASREKPIVLIRKHDRSELETISPGLGNIGIMLPYSGVHHLLFHYLDKNIGAVVMTSANPSGEPMAIEELDILKVGIPGPYLLHNRRIANRCDDSLMIRHAGHNYFIRRSRGFVPVPLAISQQGNYLGLGAHENLTSAIGSAGFIYPSQYVGKSNKYGVLEFLESATRHMMKLRGIDSLVGIGMDMHPGYSNRKLASRLSEEFGAEIIEIQHHWAHAASLLVDDSIDEAVIITLDGTGYGVDGNAWGGEVLAATLSDYERVGHLAEFPLLGGEAAIRDTRRLAFSMARLSDRNYPVLPEEQDIFEKMMASAPLTTSMGRVLDAVSCVLGICEKRSYDGEPAMKLEKYININIDNNLFNLFNINNGVIDHITPFGELSDMIPGPMDEGRRVELASGYVSGLVKAFSEVAVETASGRGIEKIGLTGGVSYNIPIVEMFMRELASRGYELVRHDRVPNGDGGISVGQCAIAGARFEP